MNEEEKFDELINSKLSEREFPFDELNWDEAERLIIRQERWSKITRVSLVFSAGLVLGVAVMLPFVITNHNAITNPVASKINVNRSPIVQNNIAAPVNQPEKASSNSNTNSLKDVKAPMPLQSAFVKKENSTGTRATSSKISSGRKKTNTQAVVIAEADNKKIHKQHSQQAAKNNIVASAVKANKISRHKEIINSKKPNDVANQVADVNPAPVKNKPIFETGNSINNPPETKKNSTTKNTPVTDNKIGATTTPVKDNFSTDGGVSLKSTGSTDGIKKDTNKVNDRNMLPGTGSLWGPVYKANIISVYGGGSYSLGWKNNGTTEANGLTLLGGFSYTHYFSQKVAASIGIGYSELSKLDKTYTSSIIEYDFGQNASVTEVTPQKVYYLAFPVKLCYDFDGKNVLSMGLDYLLLMTTSSTVTTYQKDAFGTQTGITSAMQNGYVQGFNNFDFQFTLCYARMFTDRLGLGLEFYHGFVYIENSSFPDINQYERNSGFRLVLSYQLMK